MSFTVRRTRKLSSEGADPGNDAGIRDECADSDRGFQCRPFGDHGDTPKPSVEAPDATGLVAMWIFISRR